MDFVKPGSETLDPLALKQAQAIELLEADQSQFELTNDNVASIALAFSNKPGLLTPYLSMKQSDVRHAFIGKIIQQQNGRE